MKNIILLFLLVCSLTSLAQIGLYTPTGTVAGTTTNSSTGNIGIGNTDPQVKLDLGTTQGNGLQFRYDQSTNYRIRLSPYWNSGSDTRLDFNFERASGQGFTTVMSVGYNNNVGIGQSSPSEKLEIQSVSPSVRVGDTQDVSTFGTNFRELSSVKFYHHYNTLIGAKIYATKEYATRSWGGTDLRFAVSNVSNNSIVDAMTIAYTGNVGIGQSSPSEKLEIQSVSPSVRVGDTQDVSTFGTNFRELSSVKFYHHYNTLIGAKIYATKEYATRSWGGTDLRFAVSNVSNNSIVDAMTIAYTGNVGIGNTNPDAKLTVTGLVHAQEVKVTINAPGPDYVFEKDYKLTSLEEIKNYIDQNKHLPEVPSAREMEKNGVQLGEMNMLLLKKIEELTLYVIDLKNESQIIKEENATRKKENNEMRKRLEKIENK